MADPTPAAPMWSTITELVAWPDHSNGRDEHELTLRILASVSARRDRG